mgnify:CR=1 FL=1
MDPERGFLFKKQFEWYRGWIITRLKVSLLWGDFFIAPTEGFYGKLQNLPKLYRRDGGR